MGFRVTIAGLGLMGGSLAKALRGWRGAEIIGIESDKGVLGRALAEKVIDRGYLAGEMNPFEALSGEVVIIALHPMAALDFIEDYGGYACEGSVWTDIVGVKKSVLEQAEKFIPESADFIGGHPMAGLEKFGYGHSTAALFENCNYVIVAPAAARAQSLELVREMAFYIGAARITLSDALLHDTMIAYVSQMPHVLAPAIISSPNYFGSKGFEGGSFHDLTRVGTLDPKLWSELFMLNSEPLCRVLKELEEASGRLRKMIESEDGASLAGALAEKAARKQQWTEMRPPAPVVERTYID